jgi:IS30 family transposase
MEEEYRRLRDRIAGDRLRKLALLKKEGYSNAEIAKQLGCAPATVERVLRLIRGIWGKEEPR